jgi:hypothetical protein
MSETHDTFFEANVAPIFIIGSAVFSIFWGTVNALLVKNVDMSDTTHVKQLLENCDEDDRETDKDTGEPITADKIMDTITFIGEKITEGAISFLAREYLYLGIFSGLFAVVLGLTVDSQ